MERTAILGEIRESPLLPVFGRLGRPPLLFINLGRLRRGLPVFRNTRELPPGLSLLLKEIRGRPPQFPTVF